MAAAVWNNIVAPHVKGAGVMDTVVQDQLNKVAAAANAYGRKQAAKMAARTGAGGVSMLGGGRSFLAGNAGSALRAMMNEADAIASHDYPYEWGGGHGSLGVPSPAISGGPSGGPGVGFDCSGRCPLSSVPGICCPVRRSRPTS